MGRPLKDKFFGNTTSAGVGGEGIASVTLGGSWTGFATATTVVSFSAPNITGGVTATATPVISGTTLTGITINNPGSGYTTTSSLWMNVVDPDGGAESSGTYVVALTASVQNALSFTAFVPVASNGTANTGGSGINGGDIVKQTGTSRYYVRNSQGYGACKLIASNTATIGTMYIVATDANGSTYWVTKLTNREARLTRRTMNTAYVYATNDQAGWTFGSATGTNKLLPGTVVSIANA